MASARASVASMSFSEAPACGVLRAPQAQARLRGQRGRRPPRGACAMHASASRLAAAPAARAAADRPHARSCSHPRRWPRPTPRSRHASAPARTAGAPAACRRRAARPQAAQRAALSRLRRTRRQLRQDEALQTQVGESSAPGALFRQTPGAQRAGLGARLGQARIDDREDGGGQRRPIASRSQVISEGQARKRTRLRGIEQHGDRLAGPRAAAPKAPARPA
jgi:hypothetical protein